MTLRAFYVVEDLAGTPSCSEKSKSVDTARLRAQLVPSKNSWQAGVVSSGTPCCALLRASAGFGWNAVLQ